MELYDLFTDPESTVPSLVQGASRLLPELLGLVEEHEAPGIHTSFYRAKVSLKDEKQRRTSDTTATTHGESLASLNDTQFRHSPQTPRRSMPRFPMDVVSDNTVDRRSRVFLTADIPFSLESTKTHILGGDEASLGKIEIVCYCYDVFRHGDHEQQQQKSRPTATPQQMNKLRNIASRLGKVIESRRRQQGLEQELYSLKEANRRLVESQNLAKVGQWELDLTSNELYWSDAIYTLFRVDKNKFGASYEAFLDAIHPEDREIVDESYTRSLETKQSYDIVHRLLFINPDSGDEEIRWVREICRTEYDELNGKPLYSVGIVQDITDERRAMDEAEGLSYLKSNRKIHFSSLDDRWSTGCNFNPVIKTVR
ncbi:MAG: hypothetical protein SGILL_003473 [Bacillariaceae sp.]